MTTFNLSNTESGGFAAALDANFTEVTAAAAAAQTDATAALNAGKPFMATATLTAAAAATGVTVLADSVVGTDTVYVTGFRLKVSGATAWTDATATIVTLQDTEGTPVSGIIFAKAGLTGNAIIDSLADSNLTVGDSIAINDGFTAGKGLVLIGDADFGAGSDIVVTVFGYIA